MIRWTSDELQFLGNQILAERRKGPPLKMRAEIQRAQLQLPAERRKRCIDSRLEKRIKEILELNKLRKETYLSALDIEAIATRTAQIVIEILRADMAG